MSLVGCGGGNQEKGAEDGVIPVRTVDVPTTTTRYEVLSPNMEPTLHCATPVDGCLANASDTAIVEQPVEEVSRGDVLVFRAPPEAIRECGAGGTFMKRVIAAGSETWRMENGVVYVNEKRLIEPYLEPANRGTDTQPSRKVPRGHYVMLGDNRTHSCDSRQWGPVPTANLIGRVVEIERPG